MILPSKTRKSLVNKINMLNGQAIIEVNKGLGHNFSEDFTEQLEKNLRWAINK